MSMRGWVIIVSIAVGIAFWVGVAVLFFTPLGVRP
jgi:hypothetical protein